MRTAPRSAAPQFLQFGAAARTRAGGFAELELIDRIHLYFAEINADPVIFRWKYKMNESGIG